MSNELTTVTEALADEVARYLAAVDLFREMSCEPSWRPEQPPEAALLERSLSDPREHRHVH